MSGAGGKEVGRLSIKVVPDLDEFHSKIRAAIANAEKNKVNIKVDVDIEDLKKIKAELASIQNGNVKIKADLDSAGAMNHLRALLAQMQAHADANPIVIRVRVDNNRIKRMLGDLGGGGGFGGGGFGGGGGAGMMELVVGVAALLAPALALISGALAAIPALVAAIAVPIAAIMLGMDGLKEAAKVLAPEFKLLKDVMSGAFKDVFTPIFANLKRVFPTIIGSLPQVATALGNLAKGFTEYFTDSPGLLSDPKARPGLEHIQAIIKNISDTITGLAPAVTKFTDGLLYLASGVSAKLPAVSKWFESVADSFQNWVARNSVIGSDGRTPIDRAMSNLGETLKGVFDIIGDLAAKGFEWLQDPKFGERMKTFVDDVRSLVNDLLPQLKNFWDDMSDAFHDMKNFIDTIKNFQLPEWMGGKKKDAADEGKKTADKPTIGKNSFFPGFIDDGKGGMGVAQNLVEKLGLGLIPAIVSSNFDKIWPLITQSASLAMAGIGTIFQMGWQGVVNSATFAVQGLSTIWDGITGAASAAWNGVVSVVNSAVSNIIGVANQIGANIVGVWNGMVSAAQGAWNRIVSGVQSAVATIISTVAAVPGQIASIFSSAAGALVGAGKAMMDGLLSGIKSGLASVLSFASTIAGQIAAVKGPLPKDRKELVPAGQALMGGLQAGLEGGFEGVLGRAKQMAEQMAEAIQAGIAPAGLRDQLKNTMAELGAEYDQLKLQLDQTTDKGQKQGIRDQLKQLNTMKDQLRVESDQLGYSNAGSKNGQSEGDRNAAFVKKLTDAGLNLAMANAHQFASDIGISGQGAISQLGDIGFGYLSQQIGKLITNGMGGGGTTINVGSMDDALAWDRNQRNKEALQYSRR